MIPTPAKRRHQQQQEYNIKREEQDIENMEDEEEADEEAANRANEAQSSGPLNEQSLSLDEFSCHQHQQYHDHQVYLEDEHNLESENFETDELEYMRLDTIVEEDENSVAEQNEGDLENMADEDDSDCDKESATVTTGAHRGDSGRVAELRRNPQQHDDSNNCNKEPPARPLTENGNNIINNNMRKFANFNGNQMAQQQQTKAYKTNIDNQCDTNDNETTSALIKQTKTKMQQKQHQQQLLGNTLPSTNRLISEHQARQQQALFRALAERQKIMDELGAEQRVDLMSASSLSSSLSLPTRAVDNCNSRSLNRTRKRRARDGTSACLDPSAHGVPLSAVDLSSMSDRMLDELLGHIASASSSSLSSNCESLDSSDMSSSCDSESDEDGADSEDTASNPSGRPARTAAATAAALNDAPNVIGVHEDERTRVPCAQNSRQLNCRDSHRRNCDNNRHDQEDDDDDTNNDQELVVHLCPTGELADSLSPRASGSQRQFEVPASVPLQQQGSKLEQYFTSGLINPHEFSEGSEPDTERISSLKVPKAPTTATQTNDANDDCKMANGQSIEEVLARMLSALNEIGADDQEQLNELLERGFAHLEQLLNCSLTPTTSSLAHPPNNSNQMGHRSQPSLAQKLISGQHQQLGGSSTTMSKDSDYGSDTQSADCFSQYADQTDNPNNQQGQQSQQPQLQQPHNKWLLSGLSQQSNEPSESPSPSSLATTASSTQNSSTTSSHSSTGACCNSPSGVNGHNQRGSLSSTSASALSPLALELSFKLAESLHRLAQQQAARKYQSGALANEPDSGDDELEAKELESARQEGAVCQASVASVALKKSPMKSIVMINATRSPSAASIVSSLSSSLELAAQRNMTPVNVIEQNIDGFSNNSNRSSKNNDSANSRKPPTQQRQQFKTCVNLGTGEVSNVIMSTSRDNQRRASSSTSVASTNEFVCLSSDNRLAESVRRSVNTSREQQQQQDYEQVRPQNERMQDLKQENETETSQVVKVTSNSNSNLSSNSRTSISGQEKHNIGQSNFERRRSSRSSLRRRPSFSGSTHSLGTKEPGAPRPGSPVPRLLLAGSGTGAELPRVSERDLPGMSESVSVSGEQKQRQLQRALIMAQKYNYSPAKIAASKLGSKLQLKDLTSKTIWHQKQQHSTDAGIAINGSQALKQTSKGNKIKQEPDGTLSAQTQSKTPPAARQTHQPSIRVTGQVQLDISYFAKSGSLTIHVLQCTQLAPVSKRRTTSNPYVKLYLLPDKTKNGKRKSRVQRSQLNPKFDEKFTFAPLQLAQFDEKILWLSVWHKDRLGRNEFLGEILLPLSQVRHQLLTSDLCQSTSSRWYQLCERFDGSASMKQQTKEQLKTPQESDDGARSLNRASHSTISNLTTNRTVALDRRQREQQQQAEPVVDKLSELQRKAARLTTTVAPSSHSQREQQHRDATINFSLGPLAVNPNPNQTPITGQLFVALKFAPNNQEVVSQIRRGGANVEGELHVIVKEAHNIAGFESPPVTATLIEHAGNQGNQVRPSSLHPPPSGSLPNPFCKLYLLDSNGQRIAKQKTQHVKRTANPRWDQKCVFGSVKLASLSCQAIEILMFNRDSMLVSNNDYLGGIRLCRSSSAVISCSSATNDSAGGDSVSIASDQSADAANLRRSFSNQDSSTKMNQDENFGGALCSEREARLWTQMLAKPNIWVYGELRLRQLRPLIANHNSSINKTTAATG